MVFADMDTNLASYPMLACRRHRRVVRQQRTLSISISISTSFEFDDGLNSFYPNNPRAKPLAGMLPPRRSHPDNVSAYGNRSVEALVGPTAAGVPFVSAIRVQFRTGQRPSQSDLR